MLKKVRMLGGLGLVALLLVIFTRSAMAAPPAPGAGPGYRGFGFLDRVALQRVASLLGTTPADLTAQVQQGKTVAQIAQTKGVAEQAVVDTILQPFKDRLAIQVKYGYVTQAEADASLQAQQERVSQLIATVPGPDAGTGYGLCHGGGSGGLGGMMGPGGMFGTGGMMGFASMVKY